MVFKCRKRKQQNSTSAEARYSSGAQVVTLSEDPQSPSSRPPPKPRPPPKIGKQNVSSPPVVPEKFANMNNPSYGCTQGKANDDSNVYEAIDVRRSDVQEEYGGEYECI